MFCWLSRFLTSSIGKKQVLAFTGFAFCGFLIGHLLGNCLLYLGPESFNSYAHALVSNPLIYVAEAGLITLALIHLGMAIKLKIENKKARPVGYAKKARQEDGATLASKTMILSGLVILVFIVIHLIYLKFGTWYEITHDGVVMRDLYRLTLEVFSSPLHVAFYVVSMAVLAFHLSHGVSSMFQSFGFRHARYTPIINLLGKLFVAVIFVGFSTLPIWAYFKGVN